MTEPLRSSSTRVWTSSRKRPLITIRRTPGRRGGVLFDIGHVCSYGGSNSLRYRVELRRRLAARVPKVQVYGEVLCLTRCPVRTYRRSPHAVLALSPRPPLIDFEHTTTRAIRYQVFLAKVHSCADWHFGLPAIPTRSQKVATTAVDFVRVVLRVPAACVAVVGFGRAAYTAWSTTTADNLTKLPDSSSRLTPELDFCATNRRLVNSTCICAHTPTKITPQ